MRRPLPRWLSALSAMGIVSTMLILSPVAAADDISDPSHPLASVASEVETSDEANLPGLTETDTGDTSEAEEISADLDADLEIVGNDADTGTIEAAPSPVSLAADSQENNAATVDVSILYSNDFHGRIEGVLSEDASFLTRSLSMRFAATLERARQEFGADATMFLSGGDDLGATLFASSVQGEQPTIDFLNELGLEAMAVGNHEFNRGWQHLLTTFQDELDAPILGANVYYAGTTTPILPSYTVINRAGVDIAVIGVTTASVPTLTNPANVVGLDFGDPVAAVNRVTEELEALPEAERPDAIVAIYHDGARAGSLEEGMANSSTFRSIVEDTDPRVAAIFTAHTHFSHVWDAPVPGEEGKTRPLIQSGRHGNNVGQVVLTVDPAAKEVVGARAWNNSTIGPQNSNDNFILELTEQWGLEAEYETVYEAVVYADEMGREPAGEITGPITRALLPGTFEEGLYIPASNASAQRGQASALGTLVTTMFRDTLGDLPTAPDFGVMNSGGLRDDLTPGPNGVITVADAQSVLPFGNELTVVTMTGDQIYRALEQQWQCRGEGVVDYLDLSLSDNISYTYTEVASPDCDGSPMGVVLSVAIDGVPVERDDTTYHAGTISFLAGGGDNFSVFAEGEALETGLNDLEHLLAYLRANSPVTPEFSRSGVQVEGLTDTVLKGGDTRSVVFSRMNMFSRNAPENLTLEVSLLPEDGEAVTLGTFPIVDDVADVELTIPTSVEGAAMVQAVALETGTEVLVPVSVKQDAPAVTPSITLSDSTVKAGEKLTVTGAKWEAESEVRLLLVEGTKVDPEVLPKEALVTATVTEDGTFSQEITIPSATAAGNYVIVAVSGETIASAELAVKAATDGGNGDGDGDGDGNGTENGNGTGNGSENGKGDKPGSLPVTGANVLVAGLLAAALTAGGVGAKRMARRK